MVSGFYRGIISTILLNCIYRGYSIGFHDTYKTVNQDHSIFLKLFAYGLFVMSASVVLHPLDTIRRTYMNENNYNQTKVGFLVCFFTCV